MISSMYRKCSGFGSQSSAGPPLATTGVSLLPSMVIFIEFIDRLLSEERSLFFFRSCWNAPLRRHVELAGCIGRSTKGSSRGRRGAYLRGIGRSSHHTRSGRPQSGCNSYLHRNHSQLIQRYAYGFLMKSKNDGAFLL